MSFTKKANSKVFNCDATYMQVNYKAHAFDSEIEIHCEPKRAAELLEMKEEWAAEEEGRWIDIITTRSGEILAVAADGEWGQPGTYYHAVLELQGAFTVEDRENGDRENPVIDTFATREEAEAYAHEWSSQYGQCTVHDGEGTKLATFPRYDIKEVRERARDCYRDGLAMNGATAELGQEREFIVDNVKEFIFGNNILSGDAISTRDEEALFDSLTEDEQAEVEQAVKAEIVAQGWEFTV